MSFESFIAGRYTRVKQKYAFTSLISFLSVVGIAVGVMVLIAVISVMSGAEKDLRSRILGVAAQVIVMRYGGPFTDYPQTMDKLQTFENVEATTPFIYAQAMLRSAKGVSMATIKGIDPESAGNVIHNVNNLAIDSLQKPAAEVPSKQSIPRITMGKVLAEKLKLKKGDLVTLISPRGFATGEGLMPSMKHFELSGVFDAGMYDFNKSFALIHLKDAQALVGIGNAVSGIEIRTTDAFKAHDIAQEITDQLGFPYWVRDWMQMNRNLFASLKLQKIVMFIILILIILVAAFNIATALIMNVTEKTRAISIMKAMGATNRSIRKIFVMKGLALSSIGTAIGVILGFGVCMLLKNYQFIDLPEDIYYFSQLPVQIEPLDVLVVIAATFLLCLLASLYPAHRAAKLNPVDGIRFN